MIENHLGSNFDDFLIEEGILAEAEKTAIKRVFAFQIAQFMEEKNLSKTETMTQTPLQSQQSALIPAKITLEQYHRIVEAGILDGCPVELLNGVIVEMSPEGTPHASDSSRAGEFLVGLLGEQAHVRFAKPITLPNGSEPEPDLAIVERVEDYYRSHHPYPEDIFWVIEYSNTSLEKDLNIKADIYAEVGIREYWVVNLKDMKLIVFRDPLNGKYQSQQVITESHIKPLAFPNLLIPMHQLLR